MLAAGAFLALRPSAGALWLGFLPGFLIVAGIGWWDDHRPLSPWLRLGVQAIAALALAAGAWGESGQVGPAVLAFGIAMVLVNVWNFMDGINGLAASQAALAALAATRYRYAVLDLKLGERSGLQLIEPLRQGQPDLRIR